MSIKDIEHEVFSNFEISCPCDYIVESIASTLIKKGVSPDQIIFKPTGITNRSYRKDISNIYSTINEDAGNILFFLESPREGIYDTLPESIFHAFSDKKVTQSKFHIIDEIKRHREEEKHARFFFLPFEQEFFNIRQTLFSFEDEFEWLSNASKLIDIYINDYPILNYLTLEKGYLFLRLLPLIYDIRDDFYRIEKCLAMLLDMDVKINLLFKKNAIDTEPPVLGSAALGTDTIIGNIVQDGEQDLDISITPISNSPITDYLFFERNVQLLKQLCDFFIGAQYDIEISYVFNASENGMVLNKTSILGYNVYL